MWIAFCLSLLAAIASAQDVVQVVCSPYSITARIQKQLVIDAGYTMEDIHMNDRECVFTDDDGTFFELEINPLTSCDTHFTANDTHVEFTNSISTVDTGPTFPYGIVIGRQENERVLSALISCTYKIDLNVSTMFIPNISVTVIQMPDAFGSGEFEAAMAIYTDSSYITAYSSPPIMEADATLFVGVHLVGDVSDDVYLLMEECWATITDDPTGTPKYPLIEDGCAVTSSANGLLRVTQNGIGHQGLWNAPVFKFVGEGEAYDNVWLHCDLQLCINSACEPTCSARRKRRSLGDGSIWGPDDVISATISLGPITQRRIYVIPQNETRVEYVEVPIAPRNELPSNEKLTEPGKKAPITTKLSWSPTTIAIFGVLALLALVSVVTAVVVILRVRASRNRGAELAGVVNKGFA